MKQFLILALAATPVAPALAGSSRYDIAACCAGGALLSAALKYRQGVQEKSNLAVADAVVAAASGILFGWYGYATVAKIISSVASKTSGVVTEVPLPVAAIFTSFVAIKIFETVFAAKDLKDLNPWGKKSV
jgi:membrane associated rhomboid family serine protease